MAGAARRAAIQRQSHSGLAGRGERLGDDRARTRRHAGSRLRSSAPRCAEACGRRPGLRQCRGQSARRRRSASSVAANRRAPRPWRVGRRAAADRSRTRSRRGRRAPGGCWPDRRLAAQASRLRALFDSLSRAATFSASIGSRGSSAEKRRSASGSMPAARSAAMTRSSEASAAGSISGSTGLRIARSSITADGRRRVRQAEQLEQFVGDALARQGHQVVGARGAGVERLRRRARRRRSGAWKRKKRRMRRWSSAMRASGSPMKRTRRARRSSRPPK